MNLKKRIFSCTLIIFAIGMLYIQAVNHVTAFGKENKNSQSSFTIVLKDRNNNDLINYVNQPRTKFLSTKEFSRKYGQSTATINKIKRYLNKHHLKSQVYPGNLVIKVTGSRNNIETAFHFKIIKEKINKTYVTKPNKTPKMANSLDAKINGIIGLSNYDRLSSDSKSGSFGVKRAPSDFIKRYHLKDTINNKSKKVANIGIISFGGFSKNDIKTFWQKMGIKNSLNRIHVYTDTNKDNQKLSDETTMDIQQSSSIANNANINVYLAQPTISGMINSFANAIGSNKSDSISLSWGISEAEIEQMINNKILPDNYNDIMNEILLQGASQGISIFNSTGDNGAYDGIQSGITKLTVETPASSPYITAVGATTAPIMYKVNGHVVNVDKERVWSNDFLYPYFNSLKLYNADQSTFLESYFVGSGGGFSKFNATPDYQKNIPGVNSYRAIQHWDMSNGVANQLATPKVVTGTSTGRNLPDIVANGDPQTGYSVYYNGKWLIDGGTSIVAPQIAAVNAVYVSKLNHRLGLWNPRIYSAAQSSDSPFDQLYGDNATNIYYSTQNNKIYNQATGLGTVNYDKLFNLIK
ncbi:protease pro-enzyme activation domain-containing protein [Apilactobacillus apinorum]|uniref:S53 family peptidase n=1 Tax=Apilactobacillus apinorum TaxID=1218495 RepID=UPI0006B620D9|nr:S53 family peptidase [Apilactobacillus apinorum]KOY68736.1 Periplasmic aspartyl protease [Apilactobacillus apinorum]CAI2656785.1 Periplasmic aspartyl protease [Apilactobacillus apinorum]